MENFPNPNLSHFSIVFIYQINHFNEATFILLLLLHSITTSNIDGIVIVGATIDA